MAQKPEVGLQDFVVRVTHPVRRMRTITIRATSEQAALSLALAKLDDPTMAKWSLFDLVTVADSILRREGKR